MDTLFIVKYLFEAIKIPWHMRNCWMRAVKIVKKR